MIGNYIGSTAVIYARFSCSKQREASIDDQIRECRGYAERNGITIVREYADHARSGKTDDRPAFQEMIANAGESDLVLVYMMDRFSRDQYDAPIYKQELKRKGVRLVSAMEYIGESPEAVIYEKLLEGLAACESAKTSARAKRGMHGNALKCHHNGVHVFGYDANEDGSYSINDEQAAYVVEAFERRARRESFGAIASDFAERGVVTYRGNPCGRTMVENMIKSEKYAGVYSFGDVRVPDGMPRIVPDELWAAANSAKTRRRAMKRREYPLSGKTICAACGRSMSGHSCRNHQGIRYDYYACRDACVRSVRAEWLEESIAGALRASLADRVEAERVAALIVEASSPANQLERLEDATRQKAEAEAALDNIQRAIESGIIPPRCNERVQELEGIVRRMDSRIASIKATAEGFTVPEVADFLQAVADMDDAAVLGAFVLHVVVDEDAVFAVLNYRNKKGEPSRIEKVRLDNVWLPG